MNDTERRSALLSKIEVYENQYDVTITIDSLIARQGILYDFVFIVTASDNSTTQVAGTATFTTSQ